MVDEDKQEKIWEVARRLYPEIPGRLTTAFWTLGREICRPTDLACLICPLNFVCEKNVEKTRNIK